VRIRAFVLPLALICLAAGCATQLVNYADVPIRMGGEVTPSSEDVRDAILSAGPAVKGRRWTMTDAAPGHIIGWLDVDRSNQVHKHLAMVDITYSAERYSVAYRSSARLDYSPGDSTINPSYNEWVKELVEQINRTLGQRKASGAAAAPIAARNPYNSDLPTVGDTWTYELMYRSRRGQPAPRPSQRSYVVRTSSVSPTSISDELVLDGAPAGNTTHGNGSYLLTQAVSIFAPYFTAFHDVSKDAPFGEVTIQDSPCKENYYCEATVTLAGRETIDVPAGRFSAVKVFVEQRWRAAGSPPNAGQMSGSRVLIAWYVPEVKRVVRYWSRSILGTLMPFESTFNVELVSYKVK
jgi:hypothetical protein